MFSSLEKERNNEDNGAQEIEEDKHVDEEGQGKNEGFPLGKSTPCLRIKLLFILRAIIAFISKISYKMYDFKQSKLRSKQLRYIIQHFFF